MALRPLKSVFAILPGDRQRVYDDLKERMAHEYDRNVGSRARRRRHRQIARRREHAAQNAHPLDPHSRPEPRQSSKADGEAARLADDLSAYDKCRRQKSALAILLGFYDTRGVLDGRTPCGSQHGPTQAMYDRAAEQRRRETASA